MFLQAVLLSLLFVCATNCRSISGPVVVGLRDGSFTVQDLTCGRVSVALQGTTVLHASDVPITIGTRVTASDGTATGCSTTTLGAASVTLSAPSFSVSGLITTGLSNGVFFVSDTSRCAAAVRVTLGAQSLLFASDAALAVGNTATVTGTGNCTGNAQHHIRSSNKCKTLANFSFNFFLTLSFIISCTHLHHYARKHQRRIYPRRAHMIQCDPSAFTGCN